VGGYGGKGDHECFGGRAINVGSLDSMNLNGDTSPASGSFLNLTGGTISASSQPFINELHPADLDMAGRNAHPAGRQ